MTFKEKKEACMNYFDQLCEQLEETHELVLSCNGDESLYLIPKGTSDELSYYGKPIGSYRFSTHWNWYASTHKCSDVWHVQCLNYNLPRTKKRQGKGLPSKPVFGICVAKFEEDETYHTVFGEVFDRDKKEWSFKEA